jgi:hypothetical protein
MKTKAWHFGFLCDFPELNTLGFEFKYLLFSIIVAPPISFSSSEKLFSKPTRFSCP